MRNLVIQILWGKYGIRASRLKPHSNDSLGQPGTTEGPYPSIIGILFLNVIPVVTSMLMTDVGDISV